MNGDEVRDVTFRDSHRYGYDVSQVDDLIRRIAVELDAGRPPGPVIANATLGRGKPRSLTYDVEAVDRFLDLLRSRDEHRDLAGAGADPWRDLAVADYFSRSGPGLGQECAVAWRTFDQVPVTHLRWVRTGTLRSELRTAEQHTIASAYGGLAQHVQQGGRSFTRKQISESSWPGITEVAARHARDSGGLCLDPETSPNREPRPASSTREAGRGERYFGLCDEAGTPVLCERGMHYSGRADGCIYFPERRWLRFPVRSTGVSRYAIMTAVDQAGNKIARYRITRNGLFAAKPKEIEVAVHPEWKLTEELVLAIMATARWLPSYFLSG